MHEELMNKLFKKNHPYASLERSNSENSDQEDFMPVVKISSGYSTYKQLIPYPFCNCVPKLNFKIVVQFVYKIPKNK